MSDPVFQDGRHFDRYVFNTTQPNQPYVITVQAPSFAVQSALFGSDAQQQPFLIQGAYVGMPGGQVQYSGILAQPGQYTIQVFPGGDPATTGDYRLSLGEGGNGGTCPMGGTLENPISLQVGQSVNCELTSTDVQLPDPNGGIHFGKFFTFQAPGGPHTTTATAQGFTPVIQVFDPTTNQLITSNVNTLTFDFPAGRALIAITSQEVQATGPFTMQVGVGGGGNLEAFQVGECFLCGVFVEMCKPGLQCLAVDVTNAFRACAATQNDAFICAADGTLERGQVCNLCDPTLFATPSCAFGLQCVPVGNNQIPACVQTQLDVEQCGNLIDAALQNN